jgi:thiol:disulfide interchange protein DsbD
MVFLALTLTGGGLAAQVEARLVSPHDGVRPGAEVLVALQLVHEEGWHTYWTNSTTGYPTTMEWRGGAGASDVEILWPTPVRYRQGFIVDYVYEGDVVIPIRIRVPEGLREGDVMRLRADVSWLMCKEACVPSRAQVALDLPVVASPKIADVQLMGRIGAAMDIVSGPPGGWRVSAVMEGRNVLLAFDRGRDDAQDLGELYFYSSSDLIESTWEQAQGWQGEDRYVLTLPLTVSAGGRLDGVSGLLVTSAGTYQIAVPVGDALPDGNSPSLAVALLFGLLGGLILNLMPCVFPVIGLKVMGLVRQARQSRSHAWGHALAFVFGVLVTLWSLAGVILVMRAAGEHVGWGFQLQNPLVIYAGIILFMLLGLNMLGVFDIGLAASRLGSDVRGYVGSVLGGVVSVVVATPCSAPFLGTAIGYAMVQPAVVLIAVMSAVGVGFAFPYFLLAAFPALLAFLPRPGAWMEHLKKALSTLMFATVAYLVWVLRSYHEGAGQDAWAMRLAASMFLLVAAAVFYGRLASLARSQSIRQLARKLAIVLFFGAVAAGLPGRADPALSDAHTQIRPAFDGTNDAPYFIDWQPGLAETLAGEGKIVWVDFTARWCATCQVNKAVMFSSEELRECFLRNEVYALKADWTQRDERISAELAKWGRYAVPFNVIHAPARLP